MKKISLLLMALVLTSCFANDRDVNNIPAIDCHVHLWNPENPKPIGWPRPDHPLYRPMLPKHYNIVARSANIKGVVVVQSGQRLYENQWNLDITKDHDELYLGIVGNLSEAIGTDKYEPLFNELIKDPRYVGYRMSGRYFKGEDFYNNDKVWKHLKMVADNNKTLDILMGKNWKMEDVDRIATRLPHLKIMMNHICGQKVNGTHSDEAWIKQLKKVAKHKNVYVKVSGLFNKTMTKPAPKNVSYYRHNLDAVWTYMGQDRLVFGSDWPVTKLDGTLLEYRNLILDYFKPKGYDVCEKVLYKNACHFYGVKLK